METTSRACRWVCRRLPLLAGDDLVGEERRRAERHLITCSSCRAALDASRRSVSLLRDVAAQQGHPTPERTAPSVWPALARQIRESRHSPSRHRSRDRLAGFPSARMGRGVAAAAMLALTLGWVARPMVPAPAPPVVVREVSPVGVVATPSGPVEEPLAVRVDPSPAPVADVPVVAVPRQQRPSALPDGYSTPERPAVDPYESPISLRLDFVLDRGVLSGAVNQDPQRAY